MSSETTTILIILGLSLALFILFARFIGWALGLADIRQRSETIITQNNELLDALDTLIEIQTAVAKNQGIEIKNSPEDPTAQ